MGLIDMFGAVVDFVVELFQLDQEKRQGASDKTLIMSGIGMIAGLGLTALMFIH